MTNWPSLVLILSGFVGLLATVHLELGFIALAASVLLMGFGGLTFLVIWARWIEK